MNLYYEILNTKNIKERRLTNSEMYVDQYIRQNIDHIAVISITQIATESNTSRATVDRYIKKFGFNGFKEFKNELLLSKQRLNIEKNQHVTTSLALVDFAKKLKKLKAEQIAIIGLGGSYISALYLQRRLAVLNYQVTAINFAEVIGRTINSDVIIIFSNSGESPLINDLISGWPDIYKIAITKANSSLSKIADVTYPIVHQLDLNDRKDRDNQLENIKFIEQLFDELS